MFFKIKMNGRFNTDDDKMIDVYAYSITLFEVITRISAWNTLTFEQIRDNVIAGERPDASNFIEPSQYAKVKERMELHTSLTEIVRICWSPNPHVRLSFKEITDRILNIMGTVQENPNRYKEMTTLLSDFSKTKY